MTASGDEDWASAQAWAPPSASRTCQRRPVRIWVSRWRKLLSALATSAVRVTDAGIRRSCEGYGDGNAEA